MHTNYEHALIIFLYFWSSWTRRWKFCVESGPVYLNSLTSDDNYCKISCRIMNGKKLQVSYHSCRSTCYVQETKQVQTRIHYSFNIVQIKVSVCKNMLIIFECEFPVFVWYGWWIYSISNNHICHSIIRSYTNVAG